MREEQKTEKALKELLRLPANKRCVNCDSLGPQYVVSAFNVFVCTVCSGVHRQFGHRVKGVSMSTFKKDEVQTLRETGNEKFAAFFLNKWTSGALPKPVEREAPRISAWISAVYQDRRFYGEPAGEWAAGAAPAPSAAGSTSASEVPEPAMRPLHEVLGSDTPKLQVQHSGSMTSGTRGPERTVSGASSLAGGATPTRSATVPAPSGGSGSGAPAARKPLNLLDASSPTSATSASPGAARLAGAWEPFGSASPKQPPAAAAAAASQGSPRQSSAPAAEAGWASFGDTPAPATAPQQPAAAPAAEGAAGSGWEAFADGPTAGPAAPAAATAAAGSRAAEPSPPPGKPAQPQAVRSSSRPEVPMDIFFPEFEKIRATGLLPNGQPVPLPAFSHSSHAHASRAPQYQQQQQQYHQQQQQQYHQQQQQQQHHAVSNPYAAAAPARPTISIPQAPVQPGGYYATGGPSPAGYPGMPSPNPYPSPSSGYSPAGSGASSSYSPAVPPFANGGGASGGGGGGGPFADLRGSTGSLGELMPGGSAAPTPAGHRLGDPSAAYDPFAGLAPGLRAALPHGGSNGKWGSAPPPTPAGVPPFANGGAVQLPAYLSGGPFGGPAAPSPVGLAPATAAASATLYGRTPSLTGYDLSAPSAPKPQASGNPFA